MRLNKRKMRKVFTIASTNGGMAKVKNIELIIGLIRITVPIMNTFGSTNKDKRIGLFTSQRKMEKLLFFIRRKIRMEKSPK